MFALFNNMYRFYPADMPPPVVCSPLGLQLGDRGLLTLPDALYAVGAGVVAGGPYILPILKGRLRSLPRCPTGRVPTVGQINKKNKSRIQILFSIYTHG